jgi:hypothetical protein
MRSQLRNRAFFEKPVRKQSFYEQLENRALYEKSVREQSFL